MTVAIAPTAAFPVFVVGGVTLEIQGISGGGTRVRFKYSRQQSAETLRSLLIGSLASFRKR